MYSDQPEASTSACGKPDNERRGADLASRAGLIAEPPRKKSKWDDLADEEDVAAARERKRVKKAELEGKLAREREQLAGRSAAGSGRGGSQSSRESTPGRIRTLGEARCGRGPARGRDAHPLLESCRSVYSYEVSRSSSTTYARADL